jgi:hypothetical protein
MNNSFKEKFFKIYDERFIINDCCRIGDIGEKLYELVLDEISKIDTHCTEGARKLVRHLEEKHKNEIEINRKLKRARHHNNRQTYRNRRIL